MVLFILRGAFIVLVTVVAALYLLTNQPGAQVGFGTFVVIITATMAVAGGLIALDAGFRQNHLSAISGIFLGLVAGLLAAYALSFVVDLFGVLTAPEVTIEEPEISHFEFAQLPPGEQEKIAQLRMEYDQQVDQQKAYFNLLEGLKVVIGLITCYFGISLVLQTKDDFRFIIPYVEFTKQIRGSRPIVLDTSVIVDGRVLDVIETRVLQGTLVLPKFILEELQNIADSNDKLRRARGRRGLEILQKLQENQQVVDVVIDESEPEGAAVDHKLIALAQHLQARVMTNDYNLNKVATLRGVEVINLNDLAKALRPVVLPGEHMNVKLIKAGEGPEQGVGYLEDGTMVVVEGGRGHLGQQVDIMVTSTLQTSAGRMIFGRYDHETDDDADTGETLHAAASNSGDESDSASRSAYRSPRGRNPRRGSY